MAPPQEQTAAQPYCVVVPVFMYFGPEGYSTAGQTGHPQAKHENVHCTLLPPPPMNPSSPVVLLDFYSSRNGPLSKGTTVHPSTHLAASKHGLLIWSDVYCSSSIDPFLSNLFHPLFQFVMPYLELGNETGICWVMDLIFFFPRITGEIEQLCLVPFGPFNVLWKRNR